MIQDRGKPPSGVFLSNIRCRICRAGFQYQGVVPGHPLDALGLGVSQTWLVDSNQETPLVSLELFYVVQIFPWLGVQPDIQYFYNTADHQKNGLAAGCRWLVWF